MVPADAVQVTAELYEPVPVTPEVHADVPLTLTLVGLQETETAVIVEELPVMATVVEAYLVGSCTEVAVMVAVPELAGAV